MFTDTETMAFTDTKNDDQTFTDDWGEDPMFTDTETMVTRHLLMTGEKTRCLQTPKQWCLPTPNKETHVGAGMTLTGITRTTF
jgi:hypothetical protein